MEKAKRDLIVALVLVVVCLFLLGKNFFFKKKTPVGTSSLAGSQVSDAESVAMLGLIRQNLDLREEQESAANQEWGRDPFVLGGAFGSSEAASNFVLSGIAWDAKLPIAIINENVYKPGDPIDGYTVSEIRPDAVTLSRGDEKIKLELFQPQEVKKK